MQGMRQKQKAEIYCRIATEGATPLSICATPMLM
jgi:hypothetical protein